MGDTVSATFHGRDVFAPAAAHLARGLPVVAVGDGGNEIGMGLVAEAVRRVVTDPVVREELVVRGRRRAEELGLEASTARMREALTPMLAIYKQMNNPLFETYLLEARSNFQIDCVEKKTAGVYNTCTPRDSYTFGQLFEDSVAVTGAEVGQNRNWGKRVLCCHAGDCSEGAWPRQGCL